MVHQFHKNTNITLGLCIFILDFELWMGQWTGKRFCQTYVWHSYEWRHHTYPQYSYRYNKRVLCSWLKFHNKDKAVSPSFSHLVVHGGLHSYMYRLLTRIGRMLCYVYTGEWLGYERARAENLDWSQRSHTLVPVIRGKVWFYMKDP